MAITEDMEFPRLTPPGDRMPSGRSLFRRPEELTDEQLDLLAAAWADNTLAGDALTELESVIASVPGKKERVESFRSLRLVPGDESWPGMHRALRSSMTGTAIRRTIIPAILAVAAMLVLILYGPAGAKLKNPNNLAPTTASTAMTVAEIPGALPVIRNENPVTTSPETGKKDAARRTGNSSNVFISGDIPVPSDQLTAGDRFIAASQEIPGDLAGTSDPLNASFDRTMPLITMHDNAAMLAIAPAPERNLSAITRTQAITPAIHADEKNWMLRSISFLASAVTGKDKEVDGYMIASGCINGLNTILGWDMELEQVSNRAGDPVAVSFSSTLLSFTKPLNKSTP